MTNIRFKTDANHYEELQSWLGEHGLQLELENGDWYGDIFYNADLRSFCGTTLDENNLLMFSKYIPEYIEKLKNDPRFMIVDIEVSEG